VLLRAAGTSVNTSGSFSLRVEVLPVPGMEARGAAEQPHTEGTPKQTVTLCSPSVLQD
jgi:hypothetical protein